MSGTVAAGAGSGPGGGKRRTVVAVTFDHFGRSGQYALDPTRVQVVPGSWVVVESGRGQRLGRVTTPPHEVTEGGGRIRKVVRVAGPRELERQRELEAREPEAFRLGLSIIRSRRLPLKLVRVVLDAIAGRATVCVAAPDKVEADDLVSELEDALEMRVSLRQLGMRDVAKVQGGVGRCGRELCCSTHLTEYPRTSVRMAKDQGLSLADDRVAGVCGRTLCCLAYEQEFYKERRGFLPKLGKRATTLNGQLEGKCIGVDVMRMTFVLLDADGTRHRLPATDWERNADREVPEDVSVPDEALETEGREPRASAEAPRGFADQAVSADEPAPPKKSTRPPRDGAPSGRKTPRRRRRRPKKKPES